MRNFQDAAMLIMLVLAWCGIADQLLHLPTWVLMFGSIVIGLFHTHIVDFINRGLEP